MCCYIALHNHLKTSVKSIKYWGLFGPYRLTVSLRFWMLHGRAKYELVRDNGETNWWFDPNSTHNCSNGLNMGLNMKQRCIHFVYTHKHTRNQWSSHPVLAGGIGSNEHTHTDISYIAICPMSPSTHDPSSHPSG